MSDSLLCLLGGIFFLFLLEPLVVNFIYFSNIDLFLDIILTKKNKTKIIKHIKNRYKEDL